ncbi:hypothetical protein CL689_03710 [Candidatus Saccharibacteria bacterium]|nr:hypothetical protein [Candidatus Saccharibacteria bacterium]
MNDFACLMGIIARSLSYEARRSIDEELAHGRDITLTFLHKLIIEEIAKNSDIKNLTDKIDFKAMFTDEHNRRVQGRK